MKRRRNLGKTLPTPPKAFISATSPGTRLRRSKRATSPTPAKPSRLQPSEPLHMTTRAASRAASGPTNSVEGSVASGNSRRSSFTDANLEDVNYDTENERPAKRSRVSTETDSPLGHALQSPVNSTQNGQPSKLKSPSSSTEPRRSSNRKRSSDASNNESDQIDNSVSNEPNGVALKKSESDLSEQRRPTKRRKKRSRVFSPEPPPDSAEPPPELTDASTAPPSPEPNPETAIAQDVDLQNVLPNTSQGPVKIVKRLPGRRRQPHSDINIEADLRRQLQLKTAYRSVVKALKPVLGELAERTITGLENDANYHKQSDQYQVVCAQLDERLEDRLALLNNTHKHKLAQSEHIKAVEERIQNEQFSLKVRDLKEEFLLKCQHRLLQLEREAKGRNGPATDDENNVLLPRHGAQYPDKLTGPLPAIYDSRSRAYIETEKMWKDAERRHTLEKERKTFLEQNPDFDDAVENLPGGFAAFTGPDREYATASYNVGTLIEAAEEVERAAAEKTEAKTIPNSEATALQMLASLSAEVLVPETPTTKEYQKQPAASTDVTPSRKPGDAPPTSPYGPPSATSTAMSLETANSSPAKPSEMASIVAQPTKLLDTNGTLVPPKTEAVKTEAPSKSYTNKIIDLLNNDHDDPGPRMRGMRPSALTYDTAYDTKTSDNASIHSNVDPSKHPSLNGSSRASYTDHQVPEERYPHPPDHTTAPVSAETVRPQEKSTPTNHFWSNKTLTRQKGSKDISPDDKTLTRAKQFLGVQSSRDETSQEKTPLLEKSVLSEKDVISENTPLLNNTPFLRIKQMMNRQATPDRTAERATSENTSDSSNARQGSTDKVHMGPPPSRITIPHERSASDSHRLSGNQSAVSSTAGTFKLSQSPHDRPPQHGRPNSLDHGYRPPWEDGRRASAPQQHPPPVSPYGPPPQGYAPDFNGQARPPPQSGPQLPPFIQTQQAPPPPPLSYRWAHYDNQGASRQYSAPSPVSGNYNRPPPQQGPSTHQSPYPPQPPQKPPQHNSPYSGPPSYNTYPPPQQGYQPQPSLQQQQPTEPQYPPLKYAGSQYGGQPILPANMDPRNSQQAPYGQPTHPPAFSQHPPLKPQYEHTTAPSPQHDQPKRKYRGYMGIAGSEFRSYNGPNTKRRGG
ncbi:hypothetical protein K432DRAFT_52158 [Lepidopterella palustris CBS 459.81]|uniref:Uncharacterized protein n=1 Tax=Lepidopterella palustris CBS 459.81 TaxID=1314670 RepID=A0A8E2EJT1_9PEZI|nr:hypothetical protein K432DRAFT_52158 [Lepidopterella palustris CBS 459.81]